MKAPKENLDDFFAANAKPFIGPPDPPPAKLVLPSGAEKILKPLTRGQAVVVNEPPPPPRAYVRPEAFPGARQEYSWFMRSLAVGGGVVAMITFTTLSSIFIAVFEPADVPGTELVAVPRQEIEGLFPADEPAVFEDFLDEPADMASESLPVSRRAVKRWVQLRNRNVHLAAYKVRRTPRRHLVKSKFVPTKLIIYPENGIIKTRIEPQITAALYTPPGVSE